MSSVEAKYNPQECIVAYIDLLGFKHVIKEQKELLPQVWQMLYTLSEFNSPHESIKDPAEAKFSLAYSTFSDHIVLSCPVEAYKKMKANGPFAGCPVSALFAWPIYKIAELVLSHGILIRGAITVGTLHHDERVVFGEALNRAYELETNTACYPRIIIDECFFDYFSRTQPYTLQDLDGIYHLNYLFFLEQIQFADYSQTSAKCENWAAQLKEKLNKRLPSMKVRMTRICWQNGDGLKTTSTRICK